MESVDRTRRFVPAWRALALGSLPHQDVHDSWREMLEYFPALPSWPQLPRRTYLENMYTQFSERFPGISVVRESVIVDRRKDTGRGLEDLYLAYLEDDVDYGRIGGAYGAALEALRRGEIALHETPVAIKGQITGPVSWALTIVDQNRRPIVYDEVLLDAVGKHLRLKAAWQERELRHFAPQTIIFLDEPYMASFGSSSLSLSRSQVIELMEEILAGLEGLTGIHCCGNTDWSLLTDLSVDILSLDAYDYGETLAEHAESLSSFLKRGGIIAWGIVPAGRSAESESVQSLVRRLHERIDHLAAAGVPRDDILAAGLVTPSCSLGALSLELAQRVMSLTRDVSDEMRGLYGLADPAPAQAGSGAL